MSNWAIVIGINKYWGAAANLKFAVKDALSISQWLLDPEGGNVPPENLFLLTRPVDREGPANFPDGAPLPARVNNADATFKNLQDAVNDLRDRSGMKGERLFFYMAGHALTFRTDHGPAESLLMADYDRNHTNHAMSLDSIRSFFGTSEFREQLYIIDACRSLFPSDISQHQDFKMGYYPSSGRYHAPKRPPLQYTLYSAAPLCSAAEPKSLEENNSIFTEALLRGLRGEIDSKIYVPDKEKYHIRIDDLARFVSEQVAARKIGVAKDKKDPFQTPMLDIKNRGAEDMVLKITKKTD
jgi:uncharacterized caspase-like protein